MNFAFCFFFKFPCWNLYILECFCYWPNSFMKKHEGGIFNKASDWKRLFLLNIKTKKNPGCPNKEYNLVIKHFHRNIRVYQEVKKICMNQWLEKCCILGRISTKRRIGEQIWFVPNTNGNIQKSQNLYVNFKKLESTA